MRHLIKQKIFTIVLRLLYQKRLYAYYYNKTSPKINLIIFFKDDLIMEKKSERLSFPSGEVNLIKKEPLLDAVKRIIGENIVLDKSLIKKVKMIDYYRSVDFGRNKEQRVSDTLFFKVDLLKKTQEKDFLQNVELVSLEELKLECFKNKFNLYDYKLLVKTKLND